MIDKPYRRIIRPFNPAGRPPEIDALDFYAGYRSGETHLLDREYAPNRSTIVRAYQTIERDLEHLFEYIEPADGNLKTYSHRTYELLLRACTEVEANCKGILQANGYSPTSKSWGMKDYVKINKSSRLAEYQVRFSSWSNAPRIVQPFSEWATSHSLSWYQAYNNVKHNRDDKFGEANLENVFQAIAALAVVLFSQFYVMSFCSEHSVGRYSHDDSWVWHDSSLFAIKVPVSWSEGEYYCFKWDDLKADTNRFSVFPF